MALIGAMMTAWKLRSTLHELKFALAIDADDPESQDAAARLAREFPIVISCENPPLSIGTKWNRLCRLLKDCDAVSFMTERMIPITPGWDEDIRCTVEARPDRPCYWNALPDPGFAAPVIPRPWLEAVGWRPLTERFHFWFTDTWLSEVEALIFGFPQAFTTARFAGERKATMACRDVAFWVDYYAWLYPARLDEAKRLSAAFGYEWREPSDIVLGKIAFRTKWLKDNAGLMEERFGDKSPPSERYLAAKAVAVAEMEEGRARQAA